MVFMDLGEVGRNKLIPTVNMDFGEAGRNHLIPTVNMDLGEIGKITSSQQSTLTLDAQIMVKVTFNNLATGLVNGARIESSDKCIFIAPVIQAVELERDWFNSFNV